jgi:hypothetical protein
MKTIKKTVQNNLQVLNLPKDAKTPGLSLFNRDVRYLKVKDIKRAYSKLIQNYCKGLIINDDAKTITYIFSGYLQLIRDVEFETRLINLEKSINKNIENQNE